jgi:hypothetical protein
LAIQIRPASGPWPQTTQKKFVSAADAVVAVKTNRARKIRHTFTPPTLHNGHGGAIKKPRGSPSR